MSGFHHFSSRGAHKSEIASEIHGTGKERSDLKVNGTVLNYLETNSFSNRARDGLTVREANLATQAIARGEVPPGFETITDFETYIFRVLERRLGASKLKSS